jgi:spore germination protein YaaH/peptidoglycan/xylan/chitin deacetylase (PgdA/CDA1 family)
MALVLALAAVSPTSGQHDQGMEFHYNYRPATFDALRENIHRVTLVVPEWFTVDGQGEVRGAVEPRVMDLARRHGVPVMVQVKNLDREGGGFRADWAHDLLTGRAARARAIGRFLELCRAHGLDGVQLELEGVHVRDRDALTRFVRETAEALHAEGYRVSVSAIHREADAPADDSYSRWLWEHWRGVYDLAALGRAADFVRVVAYAQHTRRTPPGPSQSRPWLERVLDHFVAAVPPGKLVLGVGMGSWHWFPVADPDLYHIGARSWSRSISRTELRSLLASHGATLTWDPRQGMAYGFIERMGVLEWLVTDNDARAFDAKLRLARRTGLRGISIWIDGDEDPGIWSRSGGIPVLSWHYFVDSGEDVTGVLTDTFARFEALLRFLADHGFESVFPEEARAPGPGGEHRQVILTFDDGRKEHLRAAALLERYGFRGLFFVIPDRVGHPSGAYMSAGELERLTARGHRVAVHGYHHLSLPKAGSEVAGSMALARQRLRERGVRASTLEFAFPYGHYTPEITAALGTRYRYLMTVNPGYWEPGALPVPRMLVLSGTPLSLYQDYLLNAHVYDPVLRPLTPDGATVDTVRFLVEHDVPHGGLQIFAVSADADGQNYATHEASDAVQLRGDTLLVSLLDLRTAHYAAGREALGWALVQPVDGHIRFLSPGMLHWLVEPAAGPRLVP